MNKQNKPAQKPKKEWYAVRSLLFDTTNKLYEERTILVKATSHNEAIAIAEKDALQYADDLEDMELTGYFDTYHLFDDSIKNKTEIFSLMRTFDGTRDEYIDRFLDSGTENRNGS